MSVAAYNKTVNLRKSTGSTTYVELKANDASISIPIALLDDTDFSSTGYISRIQGLKDYNLSGTVIYKSTDTAQGHLRDSLLKGHVLDFQYLSDGTNGWSGSGIVESMNFSGDPGSLETIDVTLQSNGVGLSTV